MPQHRWSRLRCSRLFRPRLLGLFGVAMLALGACGPMKFQAGTAFDPKLAATALHPGQSTPADVQALLGTPYGTGGAMMPYQVGPRVTWTYFFDRGTVDPSSGKIEEETRYLFVFFRDNRFDSYLWFDTL